MDPTADGVALISASHPKDTRKKAAKRKPAKKKTPKRKAKKAAKRKPAKSKAKERPIVRLERLDMRLSKSEKAKVAAKAKRTGRTITGIVLDAIAALKG